MARLTRAEKDAAVMVMMHLQAGNIVDELNGSFGFTLKEAEKMAKVIDRAVQKLSQ